MKPAHSGIAPDLPGDPAQLRRLRLKGFDVLSKKCHELANSPPLENWRLKEVFGDLFLFDLRTCFSSDRDPNAASLQAELAQCFKPEHLIAVTPGERDCWR